MPPKKGQEALPYTLKALNSTRCSGRHDAVYALKEKFCNVMKCLNHIILTSTKPKERDEAMAIKKHIESFNFLCMLVVQCKILQIVNILSKAMQCKTIDLISAHKRLQIASTRGLPRQFLNKKAKKIKAYFDEISERIMLSDPKKRFSVTVFLLMMDILFCQLINRFKGMKSVVMSY